jgi:hypothetical protein
MSLTVEFDSVARQHASHTVVIHRAPDIVIATNYHETSCKSWPSVPQNASAFVQLRQFRIGPLDPAGSGHRKSGTALTGRANSKESDLVSPKQLTEVKPLEVC